MTPYLLARIDGTEVLLIVALIGSGLAGRAFLVQQQVADGRERNYFLADFLTGLALLMLLGMIGNIFKGRWP
jgi:hypothetical protein